MKRLPPCALGHAQPNDERGELRDSRVLHPRLSGEATLRVNGAPTIVRSICKLATHALLPRQSCHLLKRGDTAPPFVGHGAVVASSWSGRPPATSRSAQPEATRSSSQSISSSPNVRVLGSPQNSPIRAARSKSGSMRTCRSSARAALGPRRDARGDAARAREEWSSAHGIRVADTLLRVCS